MVGRAHRVTGGRDQQPVTLGAAAAPRPVVSGDSASTHWRSSTMISTGAECAGPVDQPPHVLGDLERSCGRIDGSGQRPLLDHGVRDAEQVLDALQTDDVKAGRPDHDLAEKRALALSRLPLYPPAGSAGRRRRSRGPPRSSRSGWLSTTCNRRLSCVGPACRSGPNRRSSGSPVAMDCLNTVRMIVTVASISGAKIIRSIRSRPPTHRYRVGRPIRGESRGY